LPGGGHVGSELRDEPLNGEINCSLEKSPIVIERYRIQAIKQ